jgi:exopolyphosphatase/guanosine-5'-triphosphate,3'-diphosphate pyrophosphatase
MRIAVVDVGTNSTRLYVADASDAEVRDVSRELVITRLGEGVDAARRLGSRPIERTVRAVRDYVTAARRAGATHIRICATSAVRDAANREEFAAAVRRATGLEPAVLSGDEEARLGFLGATRELDAGGPFLVLDVGGGSTELARGGRDLDAWISLDIGSVRMTERCVRSDPPAAGELQALDAAVEAALEEADRRVAPGKAKTLVGLAGTITTVAAISLGLRRYDRRSIHHSRMSLVGVGKIAARLAEMTTPERAALPVMPPGREDVIVAGAMILQAVMRRFGFDEVLVSESDILDGILRSMI